MVARMYSNYTLMVTRALNKGGGGGGYPFIQKKYNAVKFEKTLEHDFET
jgi:hypothetical protein